MPEIFLALLSTGYSSKIAKQWTRAVVSRLFQKTVILPPNPVSFRLTYSYTQFWDIFLTDLYQFAWIKHQKCSFSSVVQGFCSTNKPISTHYLWKCDWTIMIFINLMVVMISFTHVFKVLLLHLELKPQNVFKLKTGFNFRRSVSVRLTFWLQLYSEPYFVCFVCCSFISGLFLFVCFSTCLQFIWLGFSHIWTGFAHPLSETQEEIFWQE